MGSMMDKLLDNCIPEPNSGCWIWLGMEWKGRGYVYMNDRRKPAEMASFEEFIGPLDGKDTARNICGCSLCINPDHLAPVIVNEWTEENVRKEASKYNKKNDFFKESIGAWKAAKKMGILGELESKMEGKKIYTDDELRHAAMEFKTKTDFFTQNNKAYQAAVKRGMINEICHHMEKKKRDRKYTDEQLKALALKYTTIGDFAKNEDSAYQLARRLGILPTISSHMTRLRSELNEDQVRDIKNLLSSRSMTRKEISIKYGVALPTIGSIASGRNWAWVK